MVHPNYNPNSILQSESVLTATMTTTPQKILIIDDNEDIGIILSQILIDLGYIVEIEMDVHNAFSQILKIAPDFLILDYIFPDSNCVKFVHQLRENAATATIPLLLISGSRPIEKELNGVPFLMKPFTMNDMTTLIHQLLVNSAVNQ